MKKSRISFFIVILVITFNQFLKAQVDYPPKSFYIGFNTGISLFTPAGVNNEISNYLNLQGVVIKTGSSDIFLNFSLKLNLTYMINQMSGLSGIFDMGFSPKFIYIENAEKSESFSFNRYSSGLVYDLYLGKREYSKILIGGGVLYNNMGFKDFSASGVSFRFQIGRLIRMNTHRLRIVGVFNFMPPVNAKSSGKTIEFNYTDLGMVVGYDF